MPLEADVTSLREENAALRAQLALARARIADLEHERRDSPSFVTPNKPPRPAPQQPRKQRDPHHNPARRRETPTRIVTPALDRCPDCS